VSGCRRGKVEQGTGIGEEVVPGVLSVDASFESMPYERDLTLGERKRIASSDLR
jgi:hypothetical protein